MATKYYKKSANRTGETAYLILTRNADGYYLDDSDGSFASNPADKFKTMTEDSVVKGLYVASEDRIAFNDGSYTVTAYFQSGGASDPVNDEPFGDGSVEYIDDEEVSHKSIVDNINDLLFSGKVYIDTINGSSVSSSTLGTIGNPVDNFTDALSIANTNGILAFDVTGPITIGGAQDVTNMTFYEGDNHTTIALTSGCTTLNTSFYGHIHISGEFGGHVHCHNCHLSPTTLLEGFYENCLFDDGNYSVAGALTRFIGCSSSGQQGQAVVISASGVSIDLGIWGWTGKMELENKDGSETFDIEMLTGELEIASSCTNGRINTRGIIELTDNSGAGCNVTTGGLLIEQIDTELSTVHGAGTWDVAAVITHLTDIKGGGWSTETLVSIEAAILALNDLAQSDVVTALGTYGASTHSASDVDTVLSAAHGNGTWDAVADTSAIITHLTDIKGAGWTDENLVVINSNTLISKKVLTGRWKMINNQFIIYDADGTTPFYTFNMKDVNGDGVMVNPLERVEA